MTNDAMTNSSGYLVLLPNRSGEQRQCGLKSSRLAAGGQPSTHPLEEWRAFQFGMKDLKSRFADETAKIGYVLLWLIGVPLPILLLIYLFRGH